MPIAPTQPPLARSASAGTTRFAVGFATLGFAWALIPEIAVAQDAGVDTATDATLSPLTITADAVTTGSYQPPLTTQISRRQASSLEVPQAVSVVTRQVLDDRRPATLDESIATVSGISQANTLGGTQDAIIKRGFGDNRDGSVLRDGIRTVQPFNYTASAQRVEVLKGPSSLLYGILEPGGVINVISKKPLQQQATDLELRGSSYGQGDNGSGVQIDTTGPLGDSGFAYRMIADYDDGDYWRNFGETRRTTLAPSLAWYGEDTQVRLAYEYVDYHVPFDRGTLIDSSTNEPLSLDRRTRLDEPFNATDGQSNLVTLDASHRLDDTWTLNVAYGYNRLTYDDRQARAMSYDPDSGVVNRRIDATRGAVSTNHFATINANGSVAWGGFQHDLLMGFDYERTQIFRSDLIRNSQRSDLDVNDPDYGNTQLPYEVSAKDSDQTDNTRASSVFVQDAVHLTSRWIAIAGLRYQHFSEIAGKGRPFNTNSDISDSTMIPNLGVIYRLRPNTSLYASYTESFKPNTSIASPIGALDPEEGQSWEAGIKYDDDGGLTATLAAFRIDKENVQVSQEIDGETVTSTVGEAGSQGVELDVTGRLGNAWDLIGSVAYTDSEVTHDPELEGNRLANAPRVTAALYGIYDFGSVWGSQRLRAGGGVRYIGDRAGDSANSFELPSYEVVDAMASYDADLGGQPVTFQLNVKNLFNELYYPSSASRNYVSIGEPRQVLLTTTLHF